MPAGEKRDERLVDHLILPHDALRYGLANARGGVGDLGWCHHDSIFLSMASMACPTARKASGSSGVRVASRTSCISGVVSGYRAASAAR